jgi:hypothetical protein
MEPETQKPPVLSDGGFSFGPTGQRGSAARPNAYVDIPCNMLMRDLAAVCCADWKEGRGSYLLSAPMGSEAVICSPHAQEIVATLSAVGPKALQAFAVAVELWQEDAKDRHPDVLTVQPLRRIASGLDGRGSGRCSSRLLSEIRSVLEALTTVSLLSAPPSARNGGTRPGPPLVIGDSDCPPVAAEGIAYRPGFLWVRELMGPSPRVAKLPRSFLTLHAKNDRFKILLSWYLAIMLRVNRKYGWHYRVMLRKLLEGAGIGIPRRNVTRFLSAIYRSLETLPGVGFSGPALTLYSAEEILASRFDFWAEPELLVACRDR